MNARALTPQDRNLADEFAGWARGLDVESAFTRRRIRPSYKTMIDTLKQWADDCKDDDEMMHMSIGLDDVAAQMANAHEWANEAREQASVEGHDNTWIDRQDAAGRVV